jgi:hypothetical protein
MAENTERYKVVIDTEVQGQDNIELLNRTVKTSIGEFDNLNEAIGKTQDTLGKVDPKSKEFKDLSKELQGLKDRLKETEVNSLRFTEALAAQPGVAGLVGQSLEGLRGTFKVFMANPIIAILAGITAAFVALKESLSRTEEGQAKLNQISEAFTKIMNGLFAVIEPIAMAIADLVIQLLSSEKVMNTLSVVVGVLSGTFTALFGVLKELGGFVINNLVNYFTTLIGVAEGAGKVLKGVFTFDLALIQEGVKQVGDKVNEGVNNFVTNVKDTASGIGTAVVDGVKTGFEAGANAFKEGAARLTEAEKEAEKKRLEDAKKAAEERKKLLEEAEKIQTEAFLALLDERQRELTLREEKFIEDKKKLLAAGITDFKNLEEVYNKDVQAINDKYEAEARDKRVKGLETRFNEIVSATNAGYDELIALVTQKEDELLSNTQLTEDERKQIQLDAINERKSILEKQYADELLGLDLQFQKVLSTNTEEYDKLIATIDEKERLLLDNTELTEAERLQIANDFAQQRADLQSIDYDKLISIIDEKEKILLANTQLTENERLQIANDFAQQRADVRAEELNDTLLALDNEANNLTTSFERRREIISEQEAIMLQMEGATDAQRTAIRQQGAAQRAAIDQEELDARAAVQNAYLDLAGQFGSALQSLAGENKKLAIAGIVIEQASSIGRIIANTAVANAKAVAAIPLTAGQPFVTINTISAGLSIASSIAAATKAIRQINSAGSGGGAAASGGGGASLSSPISAPRVAATSAPQITGVEGGNNPTAQIAQTLSQRENRPIKAYVVSGDVTSQQALDRKTNRAATFSGGG